MLELKRQIFARVVLPYAVFAGLWIYLSDRLLAVFLSDPLTLTQFQTYKGLIFIFVTATLLYLLLRHELSLHDRAQAERERMNTRLSVLLENMSDGFFTLDNNYRFIQVDHRAAEMLRQKPEDLIGKRATELAQVVGSETHRACVRARAEQIPMVAEDYYPPWNRWYETRIHPSGEGLAIFFRDITERKQLEEKLLQDESILAIAQTRAKLGIWDFDLATSVGKWSAEMFSLFDIDPARGPPTLAKFLEMVHPEDRKPLMEIYKRTVSTGKPHAIEFRNNPGRGPVRYFRGNLDPMKDAHGRVTKLAGTLQDISGRKRAEAALRENEQDLEAIVENLPLTVFAKDAEQLRYVRVNRACEELMGAPSADILGKNDYDFFPPAQAEFFIAKDRETLARGETTDIPEEPIDTPHGRRLLHTRKVVVHGPDGQPRYLLGIAEDITDRRLMENALAEKQRLLSESQQIARIGSWSWDLATDAISWSEETYYIFGVSPQHFALTPDSFLNLIHPDDRAAMRKWIDDCVAGNNPGDLEFRAVLPTGETRAINGRGVLQRDAENRPVRMMGTAQDITERKRAEDALHERDEILRLFVEHSPAAIGMFDNEMLYIAASRRWLTDYDLSSRQIIGRSHYEIFPEIPQRWKDIHRRCLAGATERCDEDPFLRADGHTDWVKWEICPWRKADGGVGGIIVFSEMVTERKQAEQKLQDSHHQLEILSRRLLAAQETERRQIARELHDEIGQLLTVIKLDLQTVLRQSKVASLVPTVKESMEAIDRAVERVRDLSLNLRPSMLDDLGLVPTLRWYVQRHTKHVGVDISLDVAASLPQLIPETETACFRVAQEALTNAVRHAAATKIDVTLHAKDNAIELTVRDNGKGFDVPAARRRMMAGTGFGLLGMQERTQLAGGQLTLDSLPGAGATVRARFPLTPPKAAAV